MSMSSVTARSSTETLPTNPQTFDTPMSASNIPGNNYRQDKSSVQEHAPNSNDANHLEKATKVDTSNPFLVDWDDPDDPANPLNWSKVRRWYISILISLIPLNISFASSAYTGAVFGIIAEFKVSSTVALLGVTFFVLGFALGPLMWAPLSEMYGRNPVYLGTFAVFTIFHIPCALATNIQTILVARFIGGVFGSAPLTNAGGSLADIWTPLERGRAMAFFALAAFLGPILGPIVGGFIAEYTTWRWAFRIMLIFSGVVFILTLLTLPETYTPTILAKKAAKLRKSTGNERYQTRFELKDSNKTASQRLKISLGRPFRLLFTEPIVLLLSIYVAFVYGILYLLFEAFPLVFEGVHHLSPGISGLSFIGIGVGMVIAVSFTFVGDKIYADAAKKNGGRAPPEARIPLSLAGAILLPIGLFWFAWTTFPSVHWIAPMLAGIPFGAGMVSIFLSLTNYLVDAYLMHAASALAANALLRSLFGAAFPLFAIQLFQGLGNQWGASLLGFIAVAMAPFPFLFYKYGAKVRMMSKFAMSDEAQGI
ncbi:hypothetical protein BZG36_00885 [Bifiguratus adelaidae]|uniref:Major facilitator superfamily (MFS) profile domain-containing protein n=1 Tax=Bifiguratus adelaidae TaxID=1938954 RepID=A0A261Y5P1_9FUNG|nr:hypothetical protein BZG36_00885 [Bifiguratus adelaidae]